MLRFLILIAITSFCSLRVVAQGYDSDEVCPQRMEYAHRNQVDAKPINLDLIAGRAIYRDEPVQLCVALFTEKTHRLVAQVAANGNGYFKFRSVRNGHYRLVGRVDNDYLCPVNVIVHRTALRSGGGRRRRLVLHMVVLAIDVCSWGDIK
jgi:hypothetical protein